MPDMSAYSWCAHDPHDGPCERSIQTGSGKNPETKPCPCKRQEMK